MSLPELKISKSRLLLNIVLIYIIMLGIWDSLTNVFISNPIRIILCWISLVVLLLLTKWWKRFNVLPCDLLFILMIFVFCINNYYISVNSSFGYLRYFCVFALLFVGRTIYDFPNRVVKIYTCLSFLHVFATIWLKFDSNTYRNVIVKMFDSSRQALLLSHYSNGWIPGLANHYSSNGMYLATALLLIFSYRLCCCFTKKSIRRANILMVCAFIALLFTGKRAHMIFSVVAMLVIYFFYTADRKRGRVFKIVAIIVVIVGLFYIGYSLFPNLFSFIGRFAETAEEGDVTQGRLETWAVVMSVFSSNPIFGIGWMMFSTMAESYGVTTNAHNVYVQLLCETGIVGFSIYMAGFFFMLVKSISIFTKMRKGKIESDDKGEKCMAFSVGMQVFFLLYCITGNPLYDAPMFVPYFLSLAIATFYWQESKYSGGEELWSQN